MPLVCCITPERTETLWFCLIRTDCPKISTLIDVQADARYASWSALLQQCRRSRLETTGVGALSLRLPESFSHSPRNPTAKGNRGGAFLRCLWHENSTIGGMPGLAKPWGSFEGSSTPNT